MVGGDRRTGQGPRSPGALGDRYEAGLRRTKAGRSPVEWAEE